MADDVVTPVTPAVPAPVSADAAIPSAPVIETPSVSAPATESVAPPADPAVSSPDGGTPADISATDTPPVTDAAKTALGVVPPVEKLENEKDPAVDAEAPKAEGTQSDEPAPLPTYEPYVLPDGVQPDEEGFGNLNKMLGEFEVLTKAEHAEVQKLGQTLVDRHVDHLKKTIDKVHEAYQTNWAKTKDDWKQAFISDPEIGGNRQETTVNAALQFIRTHGGTEAQQTEFRELMETSGVGNHPAMIRLLAKANMALSEGKPLPAKAPVAEVKSKTKKWYGSGNGAA